ncbi:MAG: hypothetical protein ABEJ84_01910 [Halodesulfurarchaeum sp.]
MGRPDRVITFVLLFLLGWGLFSTTAGAAPAAAIEVAGNGDSIEDGNRVPVSEANLFVSVTGSAEPDSVILQIEGTDSHEAHPKHDRRNRPRPELRRSLEPGRGHPHGRTVNCGPTRTPSLETTSNLSG